jgi:hypothetical protein
MKDTIAGFLIVALIAWAPSAWVTHVIVCLSDEKWGFLIAGAIFFPVAIIHGTGAWFGAW